MIFDWKKGYVLRENKNISIEGKGMDSGYF